MFKKLHIEQFVIIDKLDLDFQNALTILTGETGAGKSILLDATGLILGDPSAPDSVRQGAEESVLEAVFAPPPSHPVWKYLQQQGLVSPGQQEFQIYRTVRLDGNDTIRLNGKPIDLDTLKTIGNFLVEIHGQFANQSLLDPANQLTLLDLSGGFPPEVFKNVADALKEVHQFAKELDDENLFLTTHKKELPKLEDIMMRFNRVGMKKGFIDEVNAEYSKLLIAKETSEAFQAVLAQLIAANGVVMGLSSANNTLARNKNLEEEKMADLKELLSAALDNSREAVNEMRRLSPDYEIDTAPLEKYEKILSILHGISKEVKVKFEGLADYFDEISIKLERLKNGRATIARLQDELIQAKNKYRHHAHILHEMRVAAGKVLSDSITAELAPLKLLRAEFNVLVEENATLPWTPLGLDQVTFKARMNPGMPFSPVAETASGGELARLILALKVVVQRVQTIPTLIFDEVDTGIGGAAAAAVGERLAKLAENTQVLVITHSPQVASRGDQHLHVSKNTDGITTTSVVRKLTHEERIDEISRMLAGDVLTAESKAAAQSLIDEARNASQRRNVPPPIPPQQAATGAE
ncbi:MAG: hypothetical protein DI551_11575 [Micavibrio aeruginosavorus]|uniref:DNA repair protein RecN n=1 Tax=Micavibrio aeruginosavorus TaxID=349221 RepID=A0A2W5MU51_9BACT|nr:MAG: hypothetical protein DI551_11575 [Micavibrio aeruginosavorus]